MKLLIKPNEFNGDVLSKAVPSFFHIFVIVLLVECEKKLATVFDRVLPLNSFGFST